MIVLIDNYDSFSYNVYQLIGSVELTPISSTQFQRDCVCGG